ncbi:putative defense protein Hdd11-like [Acanthaster planci]|uniref:Defense protein Hdd11-like n=1 Tax=Acanthaster planci TaxID=133434 RepID=A0A8B7YV75_ACAPL|nr:putative defense protein Hdd11-like [Acanthaster planci]
MALRCLMILFLSTTLGAWAFTAGPPVGQYPYDLCMNMIPSGHGESTATTEAPYRILTSSSTYSSGQSITVTVESTDSTSEIEGIFMQARRKGADRHGTKAIGTFSNAPTRTQLLTCGRPDSAWGHSGELGATAASVTWIAPPCDEGPLAFMATIVKGPKELFWTGVLSSEMTFTGPNSTDCGRPPASPMSTKPASTPSSGGPNGPLMSAMTLMMSVAVALHLDLVKF